ncbi:porin [Ralstonia solanacearum]|uniref:porin n=1 Tax=Ralstonia solanacearum TaxID=305 RepID=UPI000503BFAF|nr:porin [Ralstonia solanacearum]KFX81007.1 porin [Ralstonia solanacearum]OCQ68890.1 porin [Ralstonia solanacearum]
MNIKRAVFALNPVCACVALLGAGVSMQAVAQSSVTLYGVVDTAMAYSSNQGGHSNTYLSQGNLLASKFGLYGTEDLGGGTQALFRLESGFNSATGAQSAAGYIFNRQAFVGLSNKDYGMLTAGRQYTPYFQYVAALGPTNVLTGATGAHPGDVDALDTTLRFNNSLTYTLPKIGGLQASVQYGMGEQPGSISGGSSFSGAVRYDYQAFAWSAGYIHLKNISTSNSIGTFANNAPINSGYASADSAQMIATAARYTFDKLMVGLNYSNVQYKPGAGSLFTETAMFNTYGLIATYTLTPAVTVAAGYSYTAEKARNGVSSAARYHQFSMEQTYALSKRTAFYALEAYQKASGKTLRTVGGVSTIVDAVASVGDSQNGTPSNTGHQFVGMVGIRHLF